MDRLLFGSMHIRFAGASALCLAAQNIQAFSPMLGLAPDRTVLRSRKPEQGKGFYMLYGALLQNGLKPMI